MSQFKLFIHDYPTAMGAVGLWRIYEHARKREKIEVRANWVVMKEDHLLVDEAFLDDLPELYFDYFLDRFDIAKREKQKIERSRSNPKTYFETLKQSITENIKKLERYFSADPAFLAMKEAAERLKTIKGEGEVEELDGIAAEYAKLLSTSSFTEKLTLNYVKSVILRPYLGQVSFLNVSKNSLNLAGHRDLLRNDYILPVLYDRSLMQRVADAQSTAEMAALLDKQGSFPYNSWKKAIKKMSPAEAAQYIWNQPRCVFFDDWLATTNYEEMVFSPLAVSSKACNFSWNLSNKQPVPLSTWAKLVLLLAPAGLTQYPRRQGDKQVYHQGFVYCDGTTADIIRMNEDFIGLERGNSFPEVVYRLLRVEEKKAKYQKENILFLEIFADYDSKKTLLDYFSVPRYLLDYFETSDEEIGRIRERTFRDEFLQLTLRSEDAKQLIYRYVRELLAERQDGRGYKNAWDVWTAVLERYRILWYRNKYGWKKQRNLQKGENLVNDVARVRKVFYQGREIRRKLLATSSQRQKESEGSYIPDGDKKLTSIVYRLLNACKAGNRKLFLDTVLRLHLQSEVPISHELLNVLHEEQMDFDTFAGAFIAGLLAHGEEGTNKKVEADSPGDDQP